MQYVYIMTCFYILIQEERRAAREEAARLSNENSEAETLEKKESIV